jgi:hypothetical protein
MMYFLTAFVLFFLNSDTASAMAKTRKLPPEIEEMRRRREPLEASLSVHHVSMTRENRLASVFKDRPNRQDVTCENFTGTHHGNRVRFRVRASGGSGTGYKHRIVYFLDHSYEGYTSNQSQFEVPLSGADTSTWIEMPKLRDEVPFVQQSFFVLTEDDAGHQSTDTIQFLVSRPVILTVSRGAEANANNCFERYPAYPSISGVISNGSSTTSNLAISLGVQQIWGSTRGWQFGVFFSPLAPFNLGNLLALNYSYFRQTNKQTVETIEVKSEYTLNPGDYIQVYTQPVRYITTYDATGVSPCGERVTHQGAYLFQWWGFSYHVYQVNPFSTSPPPVDAVGAPVLNTCPANPDFEYRRMNP